MEIPLTGNTVKEYEIKIGYDANSNSLLDDGEINRIELYKRRPANQPRYLTIKGISNEKYAEHKGTILDKVHGNNLGPGGLIDLNEDPPTSVARHARSFLALFYYKGNTAKLVASVRPGGPTTQQLDAFANGQGFTEWLTHNSGAPFGDEGLADIHEYVWAINSEVSEFFAGRTPFALETTMTNSQGYYEFSTATGTALKNFYNTNVKEGAEAALQNAEIGAMVTFPQGGGWYEFPRAENPNLFKSISPQTSASWVIPSTQIIGKDDNYSGFGALFTDIIVGTEEFKDFDAFGAIGRGRVLNPRYQITVKKEQTGIWPFQSTVYKVSSILFECSIEDLYDFNYEDGQLPSHAAAMQIGYGRGANGSARDQGVIYRHRINILHSYPYPFDQVVIPNASP